MYDCQMKTEDTDTAEWINAQGSESDGEVG